MPSTLEGRTTQQENFLWIIGSDLYRVPTVARTYHYMLPLMKKRSYFDSFKEQGYKLVFASDFPDVLQFHDVPPDAIEDVTGVHEQLLCEKADKFVATPGSTFSILILRNRNEIDVEDGLLMNSLHTFWIGHQMKESLTVR